MKYDQDECKFRAQVVIYLDLCPNFTAGKDLGGHLFQGTYLCIKATFFAVIHLREQR